mgnify:CR=1 FL=1
MKLLGFLSTAFLCANIGSIVEAMPVADEFKERSLQMTSEQTVSEPIAERAGDAFFSEQHIIAILCLAVVLLSIAVVFLVNERRRSLNQSSRVEKSATKTVNHVVVGSFQNVGKRKEQQDSFFFSEPADFDTKGILATVADGMGGLQGGAIMSRIIVETFRERFNQTSKPKPKSFLLETARAAETGVENQIVRSGVNGGSTLVAVMIRDDELYFFSIGDSRIYLMHDDRLIQLNEEHTYGSQLLKKAARGEISQSKALNDPERHALTAYIGMGSFNIFDRNEQPIKLSPNDKVMLCSDGVFNALDNVSLIKALNEDAISAARRLEKEISARDISDQDNFTGVILEFRAESEQFRRR